MQHSIAGEMSNCVIHDAQELPDKLSQGFKICACALWHFLIFLFELLAMDGRDEPLSGLLDESSCDLLSG
jgi:hypothetical protein